jgi:hypothetical protein
MPVDPNALFRQYHGTAFDPNSSMDRGKMQGIQQMIAGNGGQQQMLAKAGSSWLADLLKS